MQKNQISTIFFPRIWIAWSSIPHIYAVSAGRLPKQRTTETLQEAHLFHINIRSRCRLNQPSLPTAVCRPHVPTLSKCYTAKFLYIPICIFGYVCVHQYTWSASHINHKSRMYIQNIRCSGFYFTFPTLSEMQDECNKRVTYAARSYKTFPLC